MLFIFCSILFNFVIFSKITAVDCDSLISWLPLSPKKMTCTRELEVLFLILNKGKDIYTFSVPNVTIAYTWKSKLRT